MNKKETEVEMDVMPICDFCSKTANYDGKTVGGAWAYMCERHFEIYGTGLGVGKGQRLTPRKAGTLRW